MVNTVVRQVTIAGVRDHVPGNTGYATLRDWGVSSRTRSMLGPRFGDCPCHWFRPHLLPILN